MREADHNCLQRTVGKVLPASSSMFYSLCFIAGRSVLLMSADLSEANEEQLGFTGEFLGAK